MNGGWGHLIREGSKENGKMVLETVGIREVVLL